MSLHHIWCRILEIPKIWLPSLTKIIDQHISAKRELPREINKAWICRVSTIISIQEQKNEKKWFLSRKLRTLLYGEGNKINNKSCNHWLVIKLCVINDICQAIACGFDYFHCMFNSQVAPLSFLWLIVIKQANHTFLICTLYLCKRWITLLYCVTSGIGLSYDLLGLIWELQLTLTTRYPPSNLIWKYLLNSQSSTKTNKLITCSTRLMNPQVTVCICRIYFGLFII